VTAPGVDGRIADYTPSQLLGEGSQGRVYLADAPARLGASEGRVAVKVLSQATSDEDFRLAAEELKVVASAGSDCIATLYEIGHQAGRLYYAMEYLPDRSLSDAGSKLDELGVLRAVRDAARGAHALHEVGLAHRAIKPSNILVHDEGAKLSDIGLTQIISPGKTVSGLASIGSIEFMEPGMVRGERASRASDIWALGATLHRGLTGQSVYPEAPRDLLSALRQVMANTPEVASSVRPEVAEVIRSCLATDPADRPATAEELAQRIDGLIRESVPEDPR
jgi:eukaryotic-like serine/threonine-protein kinase